MNQLYNYSYLLLAQTLIAAADGPLGSNCSAGASDTTLCNPVRYPVSDIGHFLFYIIAGWTMFFALTSVIMIVFSGFRMVVSRGNEEQIASAKSALTWSIGGLIISLFAFVIIYATGEFIGSRDVNSDSYIGNNPVINPLKDPTFLSLITRLLEGFLSIVGILAVLMIVIGGFRYVTSRGNDEQSESGKRTLQWAIIGLATTLLAYVLVRATLTFFGG